MSTDGIAIALRIFMGMAFCVAFVVALSISVTFG